MTEIEKITGREYKPFNYYGAPDAENIIVAMGRTRNCKEVIDNLTQREKKLV